MMDGSIAQGMFLRSGLDRQARQFFAAILFVSIAPVVIFNPIVAGTTLSASPVDVTLMAIFLIANAHVAISGFF